MYAELHVTQQPVLYTTSVVQQEFWSYSCNFLRVIEMDMMVAFHTA